MSVMTGIPVRPGPLRRLPVVVKLGVVLAAGVCSTLTTSIGALTGIFAFGVLVLVLARPHWRSLATTLVWWLLVAVTIGGVHLWQADTVQATVVVLRLGALLLPALALAASTTSDELLDAVISLLGSGQTAATAALTLALTLRFVPQMRTIIVRRREAHLARGVRPHLLSVVAPTVVEALQHSQTVAEAIVCRAFFDRDRHWRDHE